MRMLNRPFMLAGALAASVGLGLGTAQSAEKPETLKIGISAFLSGPASVFGEPARAGAEILAEELNARGGIAGVPVELTFIDEGAGGEHLVSEYRRLVQNEDHEVMMAAISSGNCMTIAPLAEDLEVVNLHWDCGTQRIFEEGDYRFAFRTQAHATTEMMASVLYLLEQNPDFSTIAVVNQDYAWGRDSWHIFSTALKQLKPDVEVVAEFFPRFGAPDFSTEITRLLALRPDVVLSTSWGGDLDNLVRQANQRGLGERSTLVLPLAESSLERLGRDLPEGSIVGARGDHYYLHPEFKDGDEFQAFLAKFREATGNNPIYSVYHMVQAFAALEGAYEKAIEDNDVEWPNNEQVAEAMRGLEFQGYGRPVTIREDHQGVEAQLLGVARHVEGEDIARLADIAIYPGAPLMPPVGMMSTEWLESLGPDYIDSVEVDHYPGVAE